MEYGIAEDIIKKHEKIIKSGKDSRFVHIKKVRDTKLKARIDYETNIFNKKKSK